MGEGHRLLGGYRGGGDMRVGSLVQWKWEREMDFTYGVGIIVKNCGNKVYVQWANLSFLQLIYKDYLEVLCE